MIKGDDRAASAEILVHPLGEPGEEVDGVLAAHPGDEGVSAAVVTTGERTAGDLDLALTVGDRSDERAPSAEILVHPLGSRARRWTGRLQRTPGDEGVSAAAGTTDERASGDRNVALTVGDRGDDRAPSAETSSSPSGAG